jgi:hypothetical protein
MADEGIIVQIAARVEDLVAGLETAKAEIEGFASSVTAATALGEAFIAAFAVERIFTFVESLVSLGAQMDRTSKATGLTLDQLSGLRIAAAESDVAFETLQRGLVRLSTNLQTAQTATGKQAAALQALGITSKDLANTNNDLGARMELVAQRVNQFADGENKLDIITALFGQRIQGMDKVLREVAEGGFAGMTERARESGDVIDKDFTASAKNAHEQIVKFNASIEGLELQLAKVLPLFTAIAEEATIFARSVSAAFGNQEAYAANLRTAVKAAEENVVELRKRLDSLDEPWWRRGLDNDSLDLTLKQLTALKQELGEVEAALAKHATTADLAGGGAVAPSVAAIEAANKAALANQKLQEKINAELARDFDRAIKEETRSAIEGADDKERINKAYYDRIDDLIKTKFKTGQISLDQETADLIRSENERFAGELEAFRSKMSLYAQDEAAFKKLLAEKEAAEIQHARKITDIETQAALQTRTAWQNALKPIETGFGQMISAMIFKTQTWQQALANIGQQVATKMIEDVIRKIVDEWLLGEATKLLASITGAEATTAAQTSAKAAGSAAMMAMNTATITSDAATGDGAYPLRRSGAGARRRRRHPGHHHGVHRLARRIRDGHDERAAYRPGHASPGRDRRPRALRVVAARRWRGRRRHSFPWPPGERRDQRRQSQCDRPGGAPGGAALQQGSRGGAPARARLIR